jgi:glycosyltransferase involved in cell wall biosynthesis
METKKPNTKPLISLPISVVIPCYNCAATLEKAVHSIVQQSLAPKEIFLIEDCSTDQGATTKQIEKIIATNKTNLIIKAHFLSQNSGPAAARNKGWEMATGEFVAFLDADDYWLPNKLALQWRVLEQYPKLSILGANIKSKSTKESNPKKITPFYLLWKNPYFTSTVLLKRDLPFRFPTNGYYSEDFYLWAKIINHKAHSAFLMKQKLAVNQTKQKGLSANHFKMIQGELKVLRYTCKESFNYFVFLLAASGAILKLFKRLILS